MLSFCFGGRRCAHVGNPMKNGRWTCPNVANPMQNGRWTCPNAANPMQNGRWTCQNVANPMQNGRWTCQNVANTIQNGRWTRPHVGNPMQNEGEHVQMLQIPCKMTNLSSKPLRTLGKWYQPRNQKKNPKPVQKKILKLFHTLILLSNWATHEVPPWKIVWMLFLNKGLIRHLK